MKSNMRAVIVSFLTLFLATNSIHAIKHNPQESATGIQIKSNKPVEREDRLTTIRIYIEQLRDIRGEISEELSSLLDDLERDQLRTLQEIQSAEEAVNEDYTRLGYAPPITIPASAAVHHEEESAKRPVPAAAVVAPTGAPEHRATPPESRAVPERDRDGRIAGLLTVISELRAQFLGTPILKTTYRDRDYVKLLFETEKALRSGEASDLETTEGMIEDIRREFSSTVESGTERFAEARVTTLAALAEAEAEIDAAQNGRDLRQIRLDKVVPLIAEAERQAKEVFLREEAEAEINGLQRQYVRITRKLQDERRCNQDVRELWGRLDRTIRQVQSWRGIGIIQRDTLKWQLDGTQEQTLQESLDRLTHRCDEEKIQNAETRRMLARIQTIVERVRRSLTPAMADGARKAERTALQQTLDAVADEMTAAAH